MKQFTKFSALLLVTLFLFGCKTSDPIVDADERYSCEGTNPFWKLEISTTQIEFTLLSGETEIYPYKAPVDGDNRKLFVTSRETADGKSWLKISIEEKKCFNSIAGKKFPFGVEVDRDGEVFYGCGE